ncbi:MAG: alcohol dehydrogenase catalytic domain-containing protein [Actinomycetota bacterium]
MRVAAIAEPGRFEILDEPLPGIGPDEVLVRVAACGVCASELDIWSGVAGHATFPWYPGHEVSGVVEAVGGEVHTFAPGDPVTVWVTTRGFADYVAVKAEYCFPAGDVPLELALGEPLSCAINAVELAGVSLGDDVVIVGAGFMGHLVHQLVELRGPRRVIVADARQDALKRAEELGAALTVDVTRESVADVVCRETNEIGADVTFEVTGVQAALDSLSDLTRMSGTVVLAGYHQGEPRRIPLGDWNWMAFRIVNAHFREVATILRGMGRGMRLLTSGRISLAGLVTHRYPLEEIGAAFQAALDKPEGFVKATVIP